MTATLENPTPTPVAIGGARGGPDRPTLRKDRWWVEPVVTVTVLTAFVVYSTWAAFVNKDYFVGAAMHRNLISPFYSPCLTASCVAGSHPRVVAEWWSLSPALLILIFPLGFRLTCYYYRKAYYRSFWWSPPACAVADAHGSYTGESRFPLILQNMHRYFFWILLIFNVILTIDAVEAFSQPGVGDGWGISVGTVVLLAQRRVPLALQPLAATPAAISAAARCSRSPSTRSGTRLWKLVTPLNAQHMRFAWISLFFVALCRPLRATGGQRHHPRPRLPLLSARKQPKDIQDMADPEYETHDYDVIVIGAGGAGLRAAIEAKERGLRAALVCKSLLGKAHTVMAEGGMAAAMGHVWPEDNWQVHFRDTMRGGKMLNNWRMAQLHAQEAPDRVFELERLGGALRPHQGRPHHSSATSAATATPAWPTSATAPGWS